MAKQTATIAPWVRLRRLRRERGLTLTESARALGCDATGLSRIERGFFTRMPLDLALSIEREYGIPLSAWVTRKEAA